MVNCVLPRFENTGMRIWFNLTLQNITFQLTVISFNFLFHGVVNYRRLLNDVSFFWINSLILRAAL